MRKVAPVTPGEMLEEEFLKPLGLSKYRLAKEIGVPAQRIGDIVAGKRSITADTDLRLCRYFGLSDGWWLRGQTNYDMALAREKNGRGADKDPTLHFVGSRKLKARQVRMLDLPRSHQHLAVLGAAVQGRDDFTGVE